MELITPGYLTGLYHPEGYLMDNYHPEFGNKLMRGVASSSNPLLMIPSISSRGSVISNSQLVSKTGISQLGATPEIINILNSEVSLQ